MHVATSRPSAVRIRLRAQPRPIAAPGRQVRSALDVVVRGLLIGEAIGILVLSEGHGFLSVTVVGIVAIGMALVSWDR
jgi:hypothetical protein